MKSSFTTKLRSIVAKIAIFTFLFQFVNQTYVYAANYNGYGAASYADRWARGDNTGSYPSFSSTNEDCTNFVSQCIHDPSGGTKAGDYSGISSAFKWYCDPGIIGYNYTTTWINASWFANYQRENPAAATIGRWDTNSGTSNPYPYNDIGGTAVGDIVGYDWDSNGSIDHWGILVSTYGQDVSDRPQSRGLYGDLQDQHSNYRYHTLWNLYNNSDWLTQTITIMRPY